MSDFLQNPQALEGLSAASSAGQGISGLVTGFQNASNLRKEGRFAEQEAMRDAVLLIGAQTVAFAAAGVDVSSGTPLDVMADTAYRESLRAARARSVFNNEAKNQQLAGLAEFSRGLATSTDTLLGGSARRALADVDPSTAANAAYSVFNRGSRKLPVRN